MTTSILIHFYYFKLIAFFLLQYGMLICISPFIFRDDYE